MHEYKRYFSFKNFGSKSFYLGLLFLPSAVPVGAFLLLISLTTSYIKNIKNILKDRLIVPILIFISFLLIGCLINTNEVGFNQEYQITAENFKNANTWIDLFNWIPLALSLFGFQYYLDTPHKRSVASKFLIIGTFPVLLSCIMQYWFNWDQKIMTLNGLIIWYQNDLMQDNKKIISGLFSNPNYAASWLSMVWPFSLSLFLKKRKFNFKKLILLIFSSLILYICLLTNSRNGLISILISGYLLTGIKFSLVFIVLGIVIFLISTTFSLEFLGTIKYLYPENLIYKITKFDFLNYGEFTRIKLWKNTINIISKKALFGWGAGTFSLIYAFFASNEDLFPISHSHNIFLELAYGYGLPTAIIFLSIILFLLQKIFKKNKNKIYKYTNDKDWLAAFLSLIIFNVTDLTYYDGRISILFWITLSGIKCIGDEK